MRESVHFCNNCGFFAQQELCQICQDENRNRWQICLVEKPTDIVSVEKSHVYNGHYHVLNNLISPLDNIFVEDTTIHDLLERRIPELLEGSRATSQVLPMQVTQQNPTVELIVFFKSGFAGEATIAYIKEALKEKKLDTRVTITRLAQGLPLYYNPDTLDQATMAKALEDRREIV
jgi:recombination protein RecR